MSILARIFIAATVCPAYGGVFGRELARRLAGRQALSGGVIARWEMTGLLAGVAVGLLFAVLTIVCAVGRGEVVRRRIADPVLLCLAIAAIAELLVLRGAVGPEIASIARVAGMASWALGLLFVWAGARSREPDLPDPSEDTDLYDEHLPDADESEEDLYV